MYCRWNREGGAKHSRLSHRKSQIPHAYCAQTLSRKCLGVASSSMLLHLIFNGRGDPRQTCRPYRMQQFSLTGKMSVSRIWRDTRLPCCLPQNDRIGSPSTSHLQSGRDKCVAQIAMAKGLALLNEGIFCHRLFKSSVSRRKMVVDIIHFSVIAYVDNVYFIAIYRKWKVRNGRRIHLVRTCHQ